MWPTPHHVAMESGSSPVHHRTTKPQSMSLKAASKTTGKNRKSKVVVAVQPEDAAKTERAKLADSSCRLFLGSMTFLGEAHHRLESSSSYKVTLMVFMAVCQQKA